MRQTNSALESELQAEEQERQRHEEKKAQVAKALREIEGNIKW